MFKNVASQKVALFAFDTTTGAPKTGDSANITPYVAKDYGTVTVLGTTTATEMDATNAKGWYSFVLTQGETNADALLFTGKSSTANISIVGVLLFTTPANFSSMVVDSNGRLDLSKWLGGAIPAVNVTGVPLVDLKYTLGTISPAAAGSVRADSVTGAVGSVTGNVGGSVASVVAAVALTSGERNSVADAILDRDMSTGTDSGSTTVRTVRQALRFLRNKWAISGTTLSVKKEDDATESWSSSLSTDGSASPVVASDPAGP